MAGGAAATANGWQQQQRRRKRQQGKKKKRRSTMELLQLLANPLTRHQLLNRRSHPADLTKLIRNISKNLLENNIQITSQDREHLRRHKNLIRHLASPNLRNPRRYIVQSGGFLAAILPAVISIAAEYAGRLFKKKILRV